MCEFEPVVSFNSCLGETNAVAGQMVGGGEKKQSPDAACEEVNLFYIKQQNFTLHGETRQ